MTKNELHEMLMGVALVALGYALYKHFKAPKVAGAPSAAVIAASDQAAIDTAIASGPNDLPALVVPAPIPVQGGAGTGYSADTGGGGWLSSIESLLEGAL